MNDNVKDVKLTPELQARLNKYRGFADEPVFYWTPPAIKLYEPKDKWPVFKLKSRTGLDYISAEDEMGYKTVGGFTYTDSGAVKLRRLKTKILGWQNWNDKGGAPIKYDKDINGVLDELIDKMSNQLQEELYEAISNDDNLTDEELQGLEF